MRALAIVMFCLVILAAIGNPLSIGKTREPRTGVDAALCQFELVAIAALCGRIIGLW